MRNIIAKRLSVMGISKDEFRSNPPDIDTVQWDIYIGSEMPLVSQINVDKEKDELHI